MEGLRALYPPRRTRRCGFLHVVERRTRAAVFRSCAQTPTASTGVDPSMLGQFALIYSDVFAVDGWERIACVHVVLTPALSAQGFII